MPGHNSSWSVKQDPITVHIKEEYLFVFISLIQIVLGYVIGQNPLSPTYRKTHLNPFHQGSLSGQYFGLINWPFYRMFTAILALQY